MSYSLNAQKRDLIGSANSRRLRRDGLVPAALYGSKQEPISVTVSQRDLLILLDSNQHIIDLNIDGDKKTVIIKDIQFDPVKDLPRHLDFLDVSGNVTFTTYIPLHLLNVSTSHGIKMGGQLRRNLHKIKVKTTLEHLPESIDVDIKNLKTQTSYLVRHLEIPNVQILTPSTEAICSITKARAK